jgi:hypothetical protein
MEEEMIRNQKGVVVGFWVLPEENKISTHANDNIIILKSNPIRTGCNTRFYTYQYKFATPDYCK